MSWTQNYVPIDLPSLQKISSYILLIEHINDQDLTESIQWIEQSIK